MRRGNAGRIQDQQVSAAQRPSGSPAMANGRPLETAGSFAAAPSARASAPAGRGPPSSLNSNSIAIRPGQQAQPASNSSAPNQQTQPTGNSSANVQSSHGGPKQAAASTPTPAASKQLPHVPPPAAGSHTRHSTSTSKPSNHVAAYSGPNGLPATRTNAASSMQSTTAAQALAGSTRGGGSANDGQETSVLPNTIPQPARDTVQASVPGGSNPSSAPATALAASQSMTAVQSADTLGLPAELTRQSAGASSRQAYIPSSIPQLSKQSSSASSPPSGARPVAQSMVKDHLSASGSTPHFANQSFPAATPTGPPRPAAQHMAANHQSASRGPSQHSNQASPAMSPPGAARMNAQSSGLDDPGASGPKPGAIRDVLAENDIVLPVYTSGQHRSLCPQCSGGTTREKSLSIDISPSSRQAKWLCHRAKCGWKGQLDLDARQTKGTGMSSAFLHVSA